jgi:hypothetical protein
MRRTRRDQRYLLSSPWEGTLRIHGDVVIERHDEEQNQLSVISDVPARREEMLTLDVAGQSWNVRVVDSKPILVDGVVRHRLRLAVTE